MVAIVDSVVFLKVCGRANFTSSVDFKKIFNELAQRGFKRFTIDLADCQMMDSTFLGVLAGIGLKFFKTEEQGGKQSVILVNPNPRVADLLENLGVAHLFKVLTDDNTTRQDFRPVTEEGQASKVEVTKTCLEAHKLLMELNPENVRKFKDVAQFLAEDLRKMEA